MEALGYKVNPITGTLEPERPKALSAFFPVAHNRRATIPV